MPVASFTAISSRRTSSGTRTPTRRSWPTSALRHSWATCLAWGERSLSWRPEAFKGKISPAIDVYGLAATLFLLVTGEVPFPGPEVSDFYRQIEKGLPDIDPRCKGLPEPLEQVIRAGLAVDPDCRPNLVQFIATLRGRSINF